LKVDTNDLPSVAKKKVAAATASVSFTKAFPMAGLALQLELPTVVAASIPDRKVGEECCNSGLDGQLEAVMASMHLKVVVASTQLEAAVAVTSKAARLQEALPKVS
jgi:hypothetical protein